MKDRPASEGSGLPAFDRSTESMDRAWLSMRPAIRLGMRGEKTRKLGRGTPTLFLHHHLSADSEQGPSHGCRCERKSHWNDQHNTCSISVLQQRLDSGQRARTSHSRDRSFPSPPLDSRSPALPFSKLWRQNDFSLQMAFFLPILLLRRMYS